MCVKLRPDWLLPANCVQAIPRCCEDPVFIVHPATSELAEMLMVDPESLSNENYSGIYDESGDYVPQYCDNPEDIPQGAIQPNFDGSGPAPAAGAESNNDNKPGESAANESISESS